jgi:exonuclease SbcD
MFRSATRTALGNVVDVCIDDGADFLVISGDVYEERAPALADRAAFQNAMRRLSQACIPVYLVRGNHDAADSTGTELQLPASVRVFSSSEVERIPIELDGDLVAALYGTSYPKGRVSRNLAREFRRTGPEPVAIGVLHTELGSATDGGEYAPSTPEDLRDAGMDYWALGHIHKPEVVLEGMPTAAYAGSPQGLTPNETGTHGCRVVELAPGSCETRLVACSSFAWERLEAGASECRTLDDVRSAVASVVASAVEPGRGLAVRVGLTGASEAHDALVREGPAEVTELLRDDLASLPGPVWLDRLTDGTSRPLDLVTLAGDPGLPGDIIRSSDALLADPAASAALLEEAVGPVLRSIQGLSDEDRQAFDPADLPRRARDTALDRLLPGDGS